MKSNPFRKRVTLDSSERTKMKKAQNMMKVLNTKPSTSKTTNYTLENAKLTSTLNHELKMDYTKGFFLLECSCNNIDEYVNTVEEGRYSYISWKDISSNSYNPCQNFKCYCCSDTNWCNTCKIYNCKEHKKVPIKCGKCGSSCCNCCICITKPIYELDNCRIEKGLIVPIAKIDPTHKERMFMYPIPIQKTSKCCKPPMNNCTQPNPHDMDNNQNHCHYFPSHNGFISYIHNHTNAPHGTDEIYSHPHKDATNTYTILKSDHKQKQYDPETL